MSADLFALAGDLGFERKRFLQAVRTLQTVIHNQVTTQSPLSEGASPLFESVMQQIESLMKCTERMSVLTQSLESELFKEKQTNSAIYFKVIENQVAATTKELKKRVRFRIKGDDQSINKDLMEKFLPIFLKLIRPFIEFGIEPEMERLARKKNPEAQMECSITPAFGGYKLRLVCDGNGVLPPYSLELGKLFAKIGVRGFFEGKPGAWSTWSFYLPNQAGAQQMLPVQIDGVQYCIPAWAVTKIQDDLTIEVSAGFGRKKLAAENIGEPFEAYMKILDAEFTVAGKYVGVVLYNDSIEEVLSLVLNPAHLVYTEGASNAA